jgi:hypothetical protein
MGMWAKVKQWSKPVAGALLVLPLIGLDIGALPLIASVTVGVIVGAIVLIDHFKVA